MERASVLGKEAALADKECLSNAWAPNTDEVNQSAQTLFWKAAMEIGVS